VPLQSHSTVQYHEKGEYVPYLTWYLPWLPGALHLPVDHVRTACSCYYYWAPDSGCRQPESGRQCETSKTRRTPVVGRLGGSPDALGNCVKTYRPELT
jgi:hypothetical protein